MSRHWGWVREHGWLWGGDHVLPALSVPPMSVLQVLHQPSHLLHQDVTNNSFENLIMRYEEPNSMVRWDSPLFTLPWDEEPPYDALWAAVTSGVKKGPTGAVAAVSVFGWCGPLLHAPTTCSPLYHPQLSHPHHPH